MQEYDRDCERWNFDLRKINGPIEEALAGKNSEVTRGFLNLTLMCE